MLKNKRKKTLYILTLFVTMVSITNHFPMIGKAMESKPIQESFVEVEEQTRPEVIDIVDKEYTLTIEDIIYVVQNGKTYAYIRDIDSLRILKVNFDESLLFLYNGDNVTFHVTVDKNINDDYPIINVIDLNSYEKHPADTR